jgi:hypothetical protein
MGRWAQRARGGGGPPTAAVLHIIGAFSNGIDNVDVQYNGNVDALTFNAADFNVGPSGQTSDGILAQSGDTLTLDFATSIAGQATMNYNGSTTGVQTPDSIALT